MFLPPEQLVDLIENLKKEAVNIKKQIADICYHMNGGIEWNNAWGLSFEDRELIIKVINKKLKEQNPNAKEYM